MRDLKFALLGVAFTGLVLIAPAPACAADAVSASDLQREAMTREIEALSGQFPGSADEAPVFTDLGDGFYSVFIPLRPEVRESLLTAMSSRELTEMAKAQSLFVLSVGQAPVLPSNPVTTTHGALSDTTYPYTYWIITLNLGSQTVTKATTLKLTGPGLKFKKTTNVVYGANGIWGIGYSPGSGVRTPGVYTLQGSVSGGGSITTKSFAINP